MNIYVEPPYHKIVRLEKIKTVEIGRKFINWLREAFDVCLQEQSNCLKVHYPNGSFSVELESNYLQHIGIRITIESKTLETGLEKEAQIMAVLSQLHLK